MKYLLLALAVLTFASKALGQDAPVSGPDWTTVTTDSLYALVYAEKGTPGYKLFDKNKQAICGEIISRLEAEIENQNKDIETLNTKINELEGIPELRLLIGDTSIFTEPIPDKSSVSPALGDFLIKINSVRDFEESLIETNENVDRFESMTSNKEQLSELLNSEAAQSMLANLSKKMVAVDKIDKSIFTPIQQDYINTLLLKYDSIIERFQ